MTPFESQLLRFWQLCRAESGMGVGHYHSWPDGRPAREQPAVLVAAFSVIESKVGELREELRPSKPKPGAP